MAWRAKGAETPSSFAVFILGIVNSVVRTAASMAAGGLKTRNKVASGGNVSDRRSGKAVRGLRLAP